MSLARLVVTAVRIEGRTKAEVMLDPARPPPRVLAPELADLGLDLCRGLVGAGTRSMRAIGERGEPAPLVPDEPGVDALA